MVNCYVIQGGQEGLLDKVTLSKSKYLKEIRKIADIWEESPRPRDKSTLRVFE